MSFLYVLWRKIFGLFHSIIGCFRRILCCLRLRSREPDLLPYTISSGVTYDSVPYDAASDTHTPQSWEAWDKPLGDRIQDKIEQYRLKVEREREEAARKALETEQQAKSKEPNYFQELEPAPKIKTKKILLKQRNSRNENLFAVQTGPLIPEPSAELGDLADPMDGSEDAWEVEDSLDVSSVLKEARHKQRKEREQQKRNKKRKDSEGSSAQNKGLVAVKIS